MSPEQTLAIARYGGILAVCNRTVAAAWCGSSRLKQYLFRAYCRIFGYPELAAHRRYQLIRGALADRAPARVVDVGARNGLYILADALLRPRTSYVAVDISHQHLRRLRLLTKQLDVRINPVAARAESLGLPNQWADLVLTIEVLQFVEDDVTAVAEIGRILRPGGVWWCEQELDSPRRGIGPTADPTLTRFRHGYSVERLTALARDAGLRLVDSRNVDGTIARWWERFEGRIHERAPQLQLLIFPALLALATLTANRWTERSPATMLYCFERQS